MRTKKTKLKSENTEPVPERKGNKSRGRFRIRSSYWICTTGIIVLVILAFFFPQLVFKVQDIYQMDRIWQGSRNSMDLEALYGSYGSLQDRLTAFAGRKEEMEFHVTGTEYSVTQELLNTLDLAVSQECFYVLEALGIEVAFLTERIYTVEEWKQYVIYNDIMDEETTTVLMSGWYIELTSRGDITIKMLIDTETYELYYIQMVDEGSNGWIDLWEMIYKGELYGMQDAWMAYWFDYYEAGATPVQTYENYAADMENAQYDAASSENVVESSKGMKKTAYSLWEMEMELPYFDNSLMWEMKAEKVSSVEDGKGELPGRFSMGIADIIELIPEFQED